MVLHDRLTIISVTYSNFHFIFLLRLKLNISSRTIIIRFPHVICFALIRRNRTARYQHDIFSVEKYVYK